MLGDRWTYALSEVWRSIGGRNVRICVGAELMHALSEVSQPHEKRNLRFCVHGRRTYVLSEVWPPFSVAGLPRRVALADPSFRICVQSAQVYAESELCGRKVRVKFRNCVQSAQVYADKELWPAGTGRGVVRRPVPAPGGSGHPQKAKNGRKGPSPNRPSPQSAIRGGRAQSAIAAPSRRHPGRAGPIGHPGPCGPSERAARCDR